MEICSAVLTTISSNLYSNSNLLKAESRHPTLLHETTNEFTQRNGIFFSSYKHWHASKTDRAQSASFQTIVFKCTPIVISPLLLFPFILNSREQTKNTLNSPKNAKKKQKLPREKITNYRTVNFAHAPPREYACARYRVYCALKAGASK